MSGVGAGYYTVSMRYKQEEHRQNLHIRDFNNFVLTELESLRRMGNNPILPPLLHLQVNA